MIELFLIIASLSQPKRSYSSFNDEETDIKRANVKEERIVKAYEMLEKKMKENFEVNLNLPVALAYACALTNEMKDVHQKMLKSTVEILCEK